MMNPTSPNYQFERMIAQIPSDITSTFTDAQLKALKQACSHPAWKKHSVDLRFSVPFPKQSYYFVFLAGQEKRSRKRQSFKLRYSYGAVISLVTSSLLFSTTLVVGLTPSIASALRSLSHSDTHPTAIPWLQDQDECLKTGRGWDNGTCWDGDHNPNF